MEGPFGRRVAKAMLDMISGVTLISGVITGLIILGLLLTTIASSPKTDQ